MKRVLLLLGGTLVVWFGVRAVFRALASDETKIRWKIERMLEGYNTAQPRLGVAPLHEDWRHEGYEIDREMLRGALFRAMQERHPETKELLSRVTLVEDSLVISVAGDGANVELDAQFSKLRDEEWQDTWLMRIEGDLRKGEDGWKIVTSRHTDLKGTQLSR